MIGGRILQTGNYYAGTGPHPDLLTRVTEPLGGSISVTYKPHPETSTRNGVMPGVVQTVESTTAFDGRNLSAETKYTYQGGLYNARERRFLGFARAQATLPCNLAATGANETTCPVRDYTFRQDIPAAGRIEQIVTRAGATGAILRTEESHWQVSGSATALPYKANQIGKRIITRHPDGTQASQLTQYTYDVFGNTRTETQRGDEANTTDDRRIVTAYYPNIPAYIVNKPSNRLLEKLNWTSATTFTTERFGLEYFFYDGESSSLTPPAIGNLTQHFDTINATPTYAATRYTYDSFGNETSRTDPGGDRTETIYDPNTNLEPIEVRNPLYTQGADTRQRLQMTYHPVCRLPATEIDVNGQTTTQSYDTHCRPVWRQKPLGDYEYRIYSNIGSPTTQALEVRTPPQPRPPNTPPPPQPDHIWSRVFFDGFGRPVRTEAEGSVADQEIATDTQYSRRGPPAAVSRPYYADVQTPAFTRTFYDALDRPVRVTHPDGATRTMVYQRSVATGLGGLIATVTTDELGRPRTEDRDGHDRVVRTTRLRGTEAAHTTLTYDVADNILTVGDPNANRWVYTYDWRGKRLTARDPGLGTWTFTYDVDGLLTSRTDARGIRIDYTYDRLGRLTRKLVGAGRPAGDPLIEDVRLAYDEARAGRFNVGQLTSTWRADDASNAGGRLEYDYDARGRRVATRTLIDGATYTSTTAYDAGGRVLWQGLPDGTTFGSAAAPFNYDTAGQLISVPGALWTIGYTAEGAVRVVSTPTSVLRAQFSTSRGWMTALSHEVRGTPAPPPFFSVAYQRDAIGRITGITDAQLSPSPEAWTYTYDTLDQLTRAQNAARAPFDLSASDWRSSF